MSCLSMILILAAAFAVPGCGDDDTEKRAICPVSDSCPESGSKRYTYKELSQMWWQWALGISASKSPILDEVGTSCSEQQPSDTVWFLAGSAGKPVKRTCTIPAGRGLFFPVLAAYCTACKEDEDCEARGFSTTTCPGETQDDDTVLKCVKDYGFPDSAQELAVTVDGKPVDNLKGYRTEAGAFEISGPTDPKELMFPCTMGKRKAAADGVYVFIEPLSAGEHTLTFKGKNPSGFAVEVEYKLTVE
jgi:hypothetical protein